METTTAQTIARHVRALRRKRGWTQSHLAEKAGCAQTAVSQLERNLKCPTVDTVEGIAKAFGLPVWSLSLPIPDLGDLDSLELASIVFEYASLPEESRREIGRVIAAERRYQSAK